MGWRKAQGSRFRVQGSRFWVLGSGFWVLGSGGGFAAFLEDGILVSQPSPLGEGAPPGRIGHKRHERQMRKVEKYAAQVEKA